MKAAPIVASFIAVGLIAYEKQTVHSIESVAIANKQSSDSSVVAEQVKAEQTVKLPILASLKLPPVTAVIAKLKGDVAISVVNFKGKPEGKLDLQSEIKGPITKLDTLAASAKVSTFPSGTDIEIPVRILYVRGSASLKPRARDELGGFVQYLASLNPNSKIEVTYAGHSEDKLSPEFRAERADKVVEAIKRSGVQAARVQPVRQVLLDDTSSREVAAAGPSASQSPHILVRVRSRD